MTSDLSHVSFKKLRALVNFQLQFRAKKRVTVLLNQKRESVYQGFQSVAQSVIRSYELQILAQNDYATCFTRMTSLIEKYYRSIPNPITFTIFRTGSYSKIYSQLVYLEHQLYQLCLAYGASSCQDCLNILLGPDWKLSMRTDYQHLLNFLDRNFQPCGARVETKPLTAIGEDRSNLPYGLKSSEGGESHQQSVIYQLRGAHMIFPIMGQTITLIGYFHNDPLNLARMGGTLEKKYHDLQQELSILKNIPTHFRVRYIDQMSLCDFFCYDVPRLVREIEGSYSKLQQLQKQPHSTFVRDFKTSSASPADQARLITLLSMTEETQNLGQALFDLICFSPSQGSVLPLGEEIYRSLHWSVKQIIKVRPRPSLFSMDETLDLPYEDRIQAMQCDDSIKRRAWTKLREIKANREGSSEKGKAMAWLDGLLRIPFGIYRREPIIEFLSEFRKRVHALLMPPSHPNSPIMSATGSVRVHVSDDEQFTFSPTSTATTSRSVSPSTMSLASPLSVIQTSSVETLIRVPKSSLETYNQLDEWLSSLEKLEYEPINPLIGEWRKYKQDRRNYLNQVAETLECVYAQEDAKQAFKLVVGQWINGEMTGNVFGFHGAPGIGKTTLGKQGIAKCLTNELGETRPFIFIGLGGAVDGATLNGHGYTYVGSQWGKIADALMQAKCMNPIIYFDELDKVSTTPSGMEIVRFLTHLTDPEQNEMIRDKYFDVDMDLSRAMIIFSYNDRDAIDPVLMDRIKEVNFQNLNRDQKIHIGRHYLMPKITRMNGYRPEDIVAPVASIEYLINEYVYEAGGRGLKAILTQIVQEINLRQMYHENFVFPMKITIELIDDILKSRKKPRPDRIAPHPCVGLVNGLFATKIGIGGMLPIQVTRNLSDKFQIKITGSAGASMKESIACAETMALGVLSSQKRQEFRQEWERDGHWGLHVHFPATATPKDGPSAGTAITVAVISRLLDCPVKNYIALTGEIDLYGHVRQIGGVPSKIEGAIRSGVRVVLIPESNWDDWLEIAEAHTDVMVIPVRHLKMVLRLMFFPKDYERVNFKMFENVPEETLEEPVLSALQKLDEEFT